MALTRKLVLVKIFTSNHFRTHAQRERERKREKDPSPQTELQSNDHNSALLKPSSSPTTTDWAPVWRPTLYRSRRSQHRADYTAPIKQRSTPTPLDLASATQSRLRIRRVISPLDRTQSSLSLPSSLNLTEFDEFFFWVLFLLCFCIEEWYYIFIWQLRKCE